MVSKLDSQTYTSEFESHWVPLSYGLVPHLSKKLSKLPQFNCQKHFHFKLFKQLYVIIQLSVNTVLMLKNSSI